MVNRQEIKSDNEYKRGVVITDLDGTYITGNSLKWILKLGMKRMLKHGRIPSCLVVFSLLVMLKFHLVSHETMKYGALRLFGDDKKLMDQMRELGHTRRNPKVEKILADAEASGDEVLLASAASESYIHEIWDGDNVIASPFGGPDLRGERKLRAIDNWCKDKEVSIKAFLTDHWHDLPTAKALYDRGAKIYLVNPKRETIRRFDAAKVPYTLV